MITEAIILAGGFGTRLKSVVADLPKPMAPVNGPPFLNYLLSYLAHYGVKNIIVSTGYGAEQITSYYNELSKQATWDGARIGYSHEAEPLGTGGAIRLAMQQSRQKQVIVLNGDSFFDVDLDAFSMLYKKSHAQHAIALRQEEDTARYGTIDIDSHNRITAFKEKTGNEGSGLINAGIYILNKDLFLNSTKPDINFSVEKDFFEVKLEEQKICGFEFNGYFIDIGIPEDYAKAQHDFKRFKY